MDHWSDRLINLARTSFSSLLLQWKHRFVRRKWGINGEGPSPEVDLSVYQEMKVYEFA